MLQNKISKKIKGEVINNLYYLLLTSIFKKYNSKVLDSLLKDNKFLLKV